MESAFGALRLDDKDALLFPVEAKLLNVLPSESCGSYLQKCKNNLLAEIWAFYTSKVSPSSGRHWRDALMTRVYVGGVLPAVTAVYSDAECKSPMEDAAWNLAVFENTLCLLVPKREGALHMLSGKRIVDPYNTGSRGYMHLLGYVKPYHSELKAITFLQHGLASQDLPDAQRAMLRQIASPVSRTPFAFAVGRAFDAAVPSNDLQREIVRSLAYGVECIQGPPGTGKSTTIFHILQNRLPDDYKAVVTCVQNKAVDAIAEKLGATPMPFVVFGSPERLGDCARQHTLDAQTMRDPAVVQADGDLQRALVIEARLRSRFHRHTDGGALPRLWRRWWELHAGRRHEELRNDCDRWFDRAQRIRADIHSLRSVASVRLLASARAFLSTVDGLASASIPRDKTVVIIDEAGTVPEFKIPHLVCFGADSIVAIGDQNQLQPFSHSGAEGYFQRVVRAIEAPMLSIQYRMHPTICKLVSDQFYGGRLETAPQVLRPSGGIDWLDYAEAHAESRDRDKKCNQAEVHLLATFMRVELASILAQGKTVAILTFYKHQFAQLMDVGRQAGLMEEDGRFKHPNFRIVTVDAAQGSEADVVLLSCVRCNPKGELGFITNRNRLCVALSRAKERLVIVGSRQTLTRNPLWRAVWQAATLSLAFGAHRL